jgi:hypothetical protein
MGEKIKGKLWYFGTINDPNASLRKYLDDVAQIQAGRDPGKAGTVQGDSDSLVMDGVWNEFLKEDSTALIIPALNLTRQNFLNNLLSCSSSLLLMTSSTFS